MYNTVNVKLENMGKQTFIIYTFSLNSDVTKNICNEKFSLLQISILTAVSPLSSPITKQSN